MATKKTPVQLTTNTDELNLYCKQYYTAKTKKDAAEVQRVEASEALLNYMLSAHYEPDTYNTDKYSFIIKKGYEKTTSKLNLDVKNPVAVTEELTGIFNKLYGNTDPENIKNVFKSVFIQILTGIDADKIKKILPEVFTALNDAGMITEETKTVTPAISDVTPLN